MKLISRTFFAAALPLGLLVLASSCHKSSDSPGQPTPIYLVSSQTLVNGTNTVLDSFQVDSYKRLSGWIHTNNGQSEVPPFTFTYNNSTDSLPSGFTAAAGAFVGKFTYDAKGRITADSITVAGILAGSHSYTYTGNSVVMKVPASAGNTTDFQVDSFDIANGNINSLTMYSVSDGVVSPLAQMSFTYSTAINPFHYALIPRGPALLLYSMTIQSEGILDAVSTNALASVSTVTGGTSQLLGSFTATLDAKNRLVTNNGTFNGNAFNFSYNYFQ